MAGQGIEHRQVPVLQQMFAGEQPQISPDLIAGGTPNQRALGAAIAVGTRGPLRSTAPLEALYTVDRANGHMCGGPRGNEFLAPAPHDQLWQVAMGLNLLWAPTDALRDRGVAWWADHHWLIARLWTAAGLRTPCGRFKWPAGTAPLPNWTIDSLMHARLLGLSENGLGQRAPVFPLQIWAQVLQRFGDAIRARMTAAPAVQSPVRRWDRPDGGFVAAFEEPELQMNDPLRAIEVGPDGSVLQAWVSLASFPLPPDPPTVVLGHRPGEPADGSITPAPPLPPTPPTPAPSPGTSLDAIADRLDALRFAHREIPKADLLVLRAVSEQLRAGGLDSAALGFLAGKVEAVAGLVPPGDRGDWEGLVAQLKTAAG